MKRSPRLPSSPARLLAACLCLVVPALSCVGGDSTGTALPAQLSIVPSFQVLPGDFTAPPVQRIRVTAFDASSLEIVGSSDTSVDPSASEWVLAVDIDLGGASSRDVLVDIELLNGADVIWSGRLGPVPATRSGAGADPTPVTIFRGPLDNLDVTGVAIDSGPDTLLLGERQPAVASVQVAAGADVTPQIFWVSRDPTVALVEPVGDSVGVTGLTPGTTHVLATAGLFTDSIQVTVLGPDLVVAAFSVVPDGGSLVLDLEQTVFDVAVTNIGDAPAVASGVGISVLNAADSSPVQSDFSFTLPALDPGDTTSISVMPTGQVVAGALPSQLIFRARADDGDVVTESDEANNSLESAPFGVDTVAAAYDAVWLGVTDAAWETASNWNTGQAPQPGQSVYVPVRITAPVLSSDATVSDLGFENSAGLTVTAPAVLTVTGSAPLALVTGTGTVELSGGLAAVGGALPTTLVSGNAVVGAALTTADLTVDGTLSTAASVVTVVGATTVNGLLDVPAGSSMTVTGALTLAGGSTLNVDGTLTALTCVDLGATVSGGGTHPCSTGAYSRVWVGGASPDPADPDAPDNWLPSGVPTASDDVYIPATANDPAASSPVTLQVQSLVMDDAAQLDLGGGTLTVAGDVSVGASGVTGGLTVLSGSGTVLEGRFDDLRVDTNRQLSDSVIAGGDLSLNNADLTVGAHVVATSGDLLVSGSSAQLVMTDPSAVVDVDGSATFTGGSTLGLMTAGLLRVAGDFTAGGAVGTSFAATGTHVVRLDGAAGQLVSFSSPGTSQGRFQSLEVRNTGSGVTATSDLVATGGVAVASGTTFDASSATLSVGDVLTTSALTSLSDVRLIADMTVISDPLAANVDVLATVNLPADLTITGDVTLSNNDLVIGSATLNVGGDLGLTGTSAQLVMTDTNGVVDVAGSASFDGGSTLGLMSAGLLRVGGDFTVGGSSNTAFAATGTHAVELDGGGLQTVSVTSPGTVLQRFGALHVANTGGSVVLATDLVATTGFTVDPAATVDASAVDLSVGGQLSTSAGTTLNQVTLIADMTSLPASLGADVEVAATVNLPSSVAIGGNLTLNNNDLVVGPHTIAVTGSFVATGTSSQLRMQDPSGVVDVAGDATFTGGSSLGTLTAGQLQVGGNFTAGATSSTSFAATGSHELVLDGTGPQSVSFSTPGSSAQRAFDLTIANTSATVTFLSDVVVSGTFTGVAGIGVDGADDALHVGTAFQDGSDGINVRELVVIGDLVSNSASFGGDVTVQADWTLDDRFFVSGDLSLANADVIIGTGDTISVFGDLLVTGASGQLRQTDGLVDVAGAATFDGGSTVGLLTGGTLRVDGDFTATASSASSFSATGTHTVQLDGTAAQVVSFSTVGAAAQRFRNLDVSNVDGSVTFGSDAWVSGDLMTASDASVDASDDRISVGLSIAIGGGTSIQTVEVVGDLTAVPLFLNSDVIVSATFNLPSDLRIGGSLTLNNADLLVGATNLRVDGDVSVGGSSAQLWMDAAAGSADFNGSVTFDGGSALGTMTAGTMSVAGDFTVGTQSATSFAATGAHTVVLDGTVPQFVDFAAPGTAQQRFFNLTITNTTATTTFLSDVVISGTYQTADPVVTDASSVDVYVGAGWNDVNLGTTVRNLVVIGNVTSISSEVFGNVIVRSGWTLPSPLTVNGDVTVDNASLTLGGNRLYVPDADVTVTGGSGRLIMQNAADTLDVGGTSGGHVTFSGGSHTGLLTDGAIRLTGDFTASGSSTAFVGSGSHEVVFVGLGTQTLSLSAPGTTAQRFQHLTHANQAGEVVLQQQTLVMGTATASDTEFSGSGAGVLDVRGIAVIDGGSRFTGVPLRVESPTQASAHTISDLTFQGMAPDQVQLYVSMRGGVNAPLNMSNMQFDNVNLTTGLHLQTARSSGGLAEPFVVNLFSPSPSPPTSSIGVNTQLFIF